MRSFVSIFAVALLGSFATAQSEDRAPMGASTGNLAEPTLFMPPQALLGSVLQGPYDVTTTVTANPAPGTTWVRQLGCAQGWGYFWVSGGAGTTGAFAIHQFSTAGAYIQSFTQDMTGAASTSIWGIRDLTTDEANFKLWGGMENRVLKEYTFDPNVGANGTLSYTTTYQIPIGGTFTSTAVIRALTRDASGVFYTKNFSTALWRFHINGGVPTYIGESAANGKASYGLGLDPVTNMLWQFDQFPVSATDACQFNEVDPGTGALTGRTFSGVLYGVANTNIAGGADAYDDGSGVTKILALHQNTADELYVYELDPTTPPPSIGDCQLLPTVTQTCDSVTSFSGSPSATAGSGFTTTFGSLNAQVNGVVFYGVNGPVTVAWSAQSNLCVKAPFKRLGGITGASGLTGGTVGNCDGQYSFDMNAVLLADGVPQNTLCVMQAWVRDPAAPKTTQLSDSLNFTVGP